MSHRDSRPSDQREPNDCLLALRKTASQAMHDAMLSCANLHEVYQLITSRAAAALQVARVGIWLFDESREWLNCADLFLLMTEAHESAAPLSVVAYPVYIAAISTDQLVVVDDACRDPITAELAESYLQPLGISSMLDAPIVRDGGTIGVVCCEHIGPLRDWLPGELAFAETMADFVALSIESTERRQHEAEKLRLASIIEAMPDLVATVRPTGEPTYLNQAGRDLLGMVASDRLEDFNVRAIYSAEHWQQRQQTVMPIALAQGSWNGETEIITSGGAVIPVWQTVIVHRDQHGAVQYLSSIMRDLREQKRIEMELRQREQMLQQLNSELELRVAERTKQLENLNQNLETFAFSVSHDLKAPLRGIDGYSRLLLEEYRAQLPEEAQGFVDNIRNATGQMHQVIDRILTELEHDIHKHHLQIDDRIEDVQLETDLDCMMQIMRNLIDNAVKFSAAAEQPKIELSMQLKAASMVLCVKDNGCGFDMKYHERIFTIFQRLHRSDEYPGTGVGLAIVIKAAERIAGRVWAISQPGSGAAFFLEIPYVH